MQYSIDFVGPGHKNFKPGSRGISYLKLNINEKISIKAWAWQTYSNGPSAIVFCLFFPDIIERFFREYY